MSPWPSGDPTKEEDLLARAWTPGRTWKTQDPLLPTEERNTDDPENETSKMRYCPGNIWTREQNLEASFLPREEWTPETENRTSKLRCLSVKNVPDYFILQDIW